MKIEVAQHERMSESGSSLLRLIQNNEMPILDLFVRESIQNSLDASLKGFGHTNVDFNIVDFNSNSLIKELEGIEANLEKRYPDESYSLIEIRDSNTSGLTGPIKYENVKDNNFGNLLKLIYEISKPQQQEGAGGSWGLGKTVYFRIGIGLVFYYSQIVEGNGNYHQRLAACLVEDEREKHAFLNSQEHSLKRGIAWWGDKEHVEDKHTHPLTDEIEINRILDILNIKPFDSGMTGTSIIIPYIDNQKLLSGILPLEFDGISSDSMYWTKSIEEYLKVAVQRWYSPRLNNSKFKYGRWLCVKINGQSITREQMLPIFRITQELYNSTPLSNPNEPFGHRLTNPDDVKTEYIQLNNIFTSSISGYVSYTKVSRNELLMVAPNNHLSPYYHISQFEMDEDNNLPIVMYTRSPGMVVGYETSGKWVNGIPKTSKGEYIIGIFVANSELEFKNKHDVKTIEEYLRKCEKADHTSWHDWSMGVFRPNIVSKIQGHVRRKMMSNYLVKDLDNSVKRNIGLGKVLADTFLPPMDFGRKATPKINTGKPKNGKKKKRHRFSFN